MLTKHIMLGNLLSKSYESISWWSICCYEKWKYNFKILDCGTSPDKHLMYLRQQ